MKQLLKGRLFGHPVHPMLVHFPTALFSAGFLFDAAGILLEDPMLFPASLYTILLGLFFGLSAGLFGMIDYAKLTGKPGVFRKASWHAGIQVSVLLIFGAVAGIKLQEYPEITAPSLLLVMVEGVILGLMLFGNYLGGDLVFTHRIGIDE